MRVMHVVGARPNFMKAAPILREMERRGDAFDQVLVHTGQHYDDEMSAVFFKELGLPQPNRYLGVGSGSHACQTARVMEAFDGVLDEVGTDIIIVVGDVNSTLACALVAVKREISVAHVEAGLRSFDRSMPEEINRVLVDQIADLLFTTERAAARNLVDEGVMGEIYFVGNVMIDTLLRLKPLALARPTLASCGVRAGAYVLLTLHRPSNVDDAGKLREIVARLEAWSLPVVWPVHPRTEEQLRRVGLWDHVLRSETLVVKPPLGYLDFVNLEANAKVVVTDSGGVQEETTALGVPCLTFRRHTERPATINYGSNLVIGDDPAALRLDLYDLDLSELRDRDLPPLWDGRAAERVVDVLEAWSHDV